MSEKKVEHGGGGDPREFSAIRGQGKASTGPKGGSGHEERPAIAKWPPKKDKGE